MGKTKIEWSDETWNPLVGCAHVSPGCDFCYAAREASGRLSGLPIYAGLAEGGKFTGEVRLVEERLEQPLRWQRRVPVTGTVRVSILTATYTPIVVVRV